jgi:hypothetical protein
MKIKLDDSHLMEIVTIVKEGIVSDNPTETKKLLNKKINQIIEEQKYPPQDMYDI